MTPPLAISPKRWEDACRHLAAADPVMRRLIPRIASPRFCRGSARFPTLVRSIVSQQISTAAARSILQRMQQQAGGPITPRWLLDISAARLRELGVSSQKASYLHDLALAVDSRRVRLRRHSNMADLEIVEELTQVRGIGEWTAQMYLIFSLGRLDVLPWNDLGIRNSVARLYQLDTPPDRPQMEQIGAAWRPFASVAAYCCWRSL